MTLITLRVLVNAAMSRPAGGVETMADHSAITALEPYPRPEGEEMASLAHLHTWEDWGSEKLSKCFKVAQS